MHPNEDNIVNENIEKSPNSNQHILQDIINPENVSTILKQFQLSLDKLKDNKQNEDSESYESDYEENTDTEYSNDQDIVLKNYFLNDKGQNICDILTQINENLSLIQINMKELINKK